MARTIELRVDTLDYDAIQEAIGRRQRWRVLPDADDSEANLAGRLIAEICRGWMEMRDNKPEVDDEGEEWKRGCE